MRRFLSGNHSVAEAVRLCRAQFIAAYPITPQTPIYERLSEMEASGELPGTMMKTESEHSAMAACIAASLTGVRTFTATSCQGLALMHEMLHFAAGARAPVVMCVVNRTMAAPWAFWSDQTDSLSQRDTGWIQIYCESNQEAIDSVIQAYRIAESVLLPCMVVIEGHFTSHFMEPVEVPAQKYVDQYLEGLRIPERFDPEDPGFVIPTVTQTQYMRYRRLTQEAMEEALGAVAEADTAFQRIFGRGYGAVETVEVDGAEVVLVTASTIASTSRVALKMLRERGIRAGLLRIRLLRPFPTDAVREALAGKERVAVVERDISLGREGIFCSEVKASLSNLRERPRVQGYLAGIGGTDVDPELLQSIVMDALSRQHWTEGPLWMEGG